MALSRVKSDVIVSLDAAKIEDALPAIDGSPLIGVTGGVDSVGRNNLALNYFEDLIRDSIDRLALTQGWIDTFEDESDIDGEGVSVPMVRFDGVNDYLTITDGVLGQTDGKRYTISFWVQIYEESPQAAIFTCTDNRLYITREVNNSIRILCKNASGNIIVRVNSSPDVLTIANGLIHVAVAIDLANATQTDRIRLYINGVEDLDTITQLDDDTIDFTNGTVSIGASVSGTINDNMNLGQFYLAEEYIDLSVQANRELFYKDGPVDLGPNGEKPLGTAPHIYLNNSYGSFQTNLGTGGNFTENGELVDGGYITDKIYDSGADSFSNSYEIIDSYGKELMTSNTNVYADNKEEIGQAITLSAETHLTKIGLPLSKTGSPTGNAQVYIYSMTGTVGTDAEPNNNVLAISDNLDVSTLTTSTQVVYFTFPDTPILSGDIGIALRFGGGGGPNYINWQRQTSTSGKNQFYRNTIGSGSWTVITTTMNAYYLYGQKNLDLITKGSDDIGNSPSVAPTKGHMEVLLSERPKSGTSIFSSNLDSDSIGDTGASYRQKVTPTGSGNRVRFKFDGATTKPSKYDNISIGKAVGSSYVTENIPVSILFGGQQSCIVPQSGSLWSDWLDMDIDASQLYLLTFDVTSDTSFNDSRRSTTSGEGYIGDWGANNYNLTTFPEINGTTYESLGTFAISGMEVETKPTINTDIIAELSRDGGATYSPVTLTRAKTNVGGSNRTIIGGEADFNGDPSGTNIVGRIRTANKDKIDIHGISVNW